MARRVSFLGKIKSLRSLKQILKKRDGVVVFTNGCFDLLHKGHVSYLERARHLGSVLVVAVNSDASVRGLKGPTRPINPLQDRMEVLAALSSVDYVTWFDAETPLTVIEALKPDVLVKGGDWSPNQMVGAREVRGWGGRVRSLPFIAGVSTTRTVKKMQSLCDIKK